MPHWGKDDVPDDYVDIGVKDTYDLDLQQWAPQGWTGQVWFTLVLQQRTPNTFLTAELVPHVAADSQSGQNRAAMRHKTFLPMRSWAVA